MEKGDILEYKHGYLKDADPELYKELDLEKNKNIDVRLLSATSGKRVWWKCRKCGYSWKKRVIDRFTGKGCAVCANQELLRGYNDLQTKYPKLLKEWDYNKNNLAPSEVIAGGHTKYYWICKNGHSYEESILHKAKGVGCPFCAGKKVLKGYNDLQSKFPELAKEWDYEKNDLNPDEVHFGSNNKVNWICKKGHRWPATIQSRTFAGNNCPDCAKELKISFPEKAFAYYLKKAHVNIIENYRPDFLDGREIDIYIPNEKVGIEYDGNRWHKDVKKDKHKDKICDENNIILYRIREDKCPRYKSTSKMIFLLNHKFDELEKGIYTLFHDLNIKYVDIDLNRDLVNIEEMVERNEKENSLETMRPELVEEWDFEKNGMLKPENYSYKSDVKVWWKCSNCGSSYQLSIKQKCNNVNSCSICANKRLMKGYNDLATTHPELAKEWDFEKNETKPDEVISYGDRKVFWICKKGHSYPASIYERKNGSGCPFCSNKKVLKGYNDLATTHPELAKEWDYEKNEIKPDEVISYGDRKVFWICKKGHSYPATISSRKSGRGCPQCSREKPKTNYSKVVLQISMDGKTVNKYSSINTATQKTGIGHIGDVCRGTRKQAGGYIWKFKDEDR